MKSSEVRRAGRVEKLLVFGILIVIGLILVVAFNGAREGEEMRDGLVAEAESAEDEKAKEAEALRLRNDAAAKRRASVAKQAQEAERREADRRKAAERRRAQRAAEASEVSGGVADPTTATPGPTGPESRPDSSLNSDLEGIGGRFANGNRAKATEVDKPFRITPIAPRRGDEGSSQPPVEAEGAASPEPEGEVSQSGPRRYRVKSGDALASISRRFFGTDRYWPEIMQVNDIDDAGALQANTVIMLPLDLKLVTRKGLLSGDEGQAAKPRGAAAMVAADQPSSGKAKVFSRKGADDRYKIRKGDTLMAIAQAQYGTREAWRGLFQANRDVLSSADNIIIGRVLRLPKETSVQ